ncbi:MAG: ABC transporter ATP-binding protein [Leptospira sp.]|nr:ABC transporter ATP-binding protein [Leptospira sp.]
MKKEKQPPFIILNDVRKSFSEYEILKGINLEVADNEFLILIGESGSGKSTLLSLLGGQDFANSGDVVVGETRLDSNIPNSDLLHYRTKITGFVYQDFNLIPTLTLKENITLPAEISGTDYNPRRLDSLIEKFGLVEHQNKFPENLSGGEMQRTAIARSILLRPRLILADEPTGNLDSKNSQIVMKIFKDLHDEGHTIILVTHSKKIAKSGSKIVEIVNGKLKKK